MGSESSDVKLLVSADMSFVGEVQDTAVLSRESPREHGLDLEEVEERTVHRVTLGLGLDLT